MHFIRLVNNNKLLSFVAGLVLLQGVFFSLVTYLKSTTPILSDNKHTLNRSGFLSKNTSPPSDTKNTNNLDQQVADNTVARNETINETKADATVENNTKLQNNTVINEAPTQAKQTDTSNPATESPQTRLVIHKVEPGDTLTKIWVKHGASVASSLKAADAFSKANVSLGSLKLKEEIKLSVTSDNQIVRLEKKLSKGKTLILTGNSKDGYKAETTTEDTVIKDRTVSYPIYGSFSASAHEVSVPTEVIDDLVDLFSGRLDFRRDLQPGDSFTVIYSEKYSESGELLESGPIKAVSIKTEDKLLAAVRHVGKDGVERFYDENAQPIGDYFLRYPVRFTRISSIFTESRFHPVLKTTRAHNGVDFAAPTGTPVRAIGDGTIEKAAYGSDTGNMVLLKHNDRYSTSYLHLSKFAPGVKSGTRIARGQVIGYVGMTGLATGPHLHFALYDSGKFVNPLTAKLPSTGLGNESIPKIYLASTIKTLHAQHELVRLASLVGLGKNSKV
jgi:murein DD-endopeptidase MepM/ murein hydrolase activator NlpD